MPLALSLVLSLAQACAPSVAPATLLAVVRTESAFDSLTIGVNGRPHQALHPATVDAAERLATALLAQGKNLDLGLAQINARNLARLGMTVRAAFDPCQNLAAEARILSADYLAAQRTPTEAQAALRAALSAYNTGDPARGLRNGYVAKVQAAAAVVVPAIAAMTRSSSPGDTIAPVMLQPALDDAPAPVTAPPGVSLDVFARGGPNSLVWRTASPRRQGRPARQPPLTSKFGD